MGMCVSCRCLPYRRLRISIPLGKAWEGRTPVVEGNGNEVPTEDALL